MDVILRFWENQAQWHYRCYGSGGRVVYRGTLYVDARDTEIKQ